MWDTMEKIRRFPPSMVDRVGKSFLSTKSSVSHLSGNKARHARGLVEENGPKVDVQVTERLRWTKTWCIVMDADGEKI